ncbi:acetyl/propionyl-CoA carboxylase subunit alpha, partial [Klebsiella pneumoniae]|nr:acetyl/propionyl-CoA carboxylase subunit alpha [Klebsiella pneumoniae]
MDEGYHSGMTVPGAFDSLIGKLIITGDSREQPLPRAARAHDEIVIDGMPTVIPFHQAVVHDRAFTAADGCFGV